GVPAGDAGRPGRTAAGHGPRPRVRLGRLARVPVGRARRRVRLPAPVCVWRRRSGSATGDPERSAEATGRAAGGTRGRTRRRSGGPKSGPPLRWVVRYHVGGEVSGVVQVSIR